MSQLGSANLIQPQDLFTGSSTGQTVIGSYAETADGRGFRYVKAGGTTLAPGKLQQASVEDTTNLQNLTVAVNSVGDTTVTTTSTVTVTANQCAGGLLTIVSASTGAGLSYRIKSHPAASSAVVTFTLEDPIVTATTGTVKIDVVPNPYDGVIVNPATATSAPIGVALYPITNAQYGWIQTHGPAPLLAQGAIAVGGPVAASTTTAGAVTTAGGTVAIVGYAVTGIATTDYGTVFLTID